MKTHNSSLENEIFIGVICSYNFENLVYLSAVRTVCICNYDLAVDFVKILCSFFRLVIYLKQNRRVSKRRAHSTQKTWRQFDCICGKVVKKGHTNNMSPLPPSQSQVNKPKRGRGRPPGAKNRKPSRTQHCTSTSDTNTDKNGLAESENGTIEEVEVVAPNISEPMISSASTIEPCENAFVVENECQNNTNEDVVIKDCSIESSNKVTDLLGNSQFLQEGSLVLETHRELEQIYTEMSAQKVSDAFTLLCAVQRLTEKAKEPHLFELFKDLLDNYRCNQINARMLSDEITKHFHDYPDVLMWINTLVQEDSIKKTALHNEEEHNNKNTLLENKNNVQNEKSVETGVSQNIASKQTDEGVAVSRYPEESQTLVSVEQDALTLTKNEEREFRIEQITASTSNDSLLQPDDVFEAQNLDDVALLAINLLKNLQTRLINEPQIYDEVTGALCTLYEVSKNLHANTAVQNTKLTELRTRAYEIMRENLKGKTDLLEVLEAFFTSNRTYTGFPSCTLTESTGLVAKDRLSTMETSVPVLNSEQTTLSQVVVLPLNETDSQIDGDHTIVETTSKIFLPPGLVVSCSRVDESLMFSNFLLTTSTEQEQVSLLSNAFKDPSDSFEENRRKWLQYQCDEEDWIDSLVSTLGPILMRVTSLRKFITYYLGGSLLISRNGSNENVNEETEDTGPNQNGSSNISDKEVDSQEPVSTCQNDFEDTEMDSFSSGTYKVYEDTSILPKCSGRTDLCNEVLNDTYYSAVSRRKKFWTNLRTDEEERLDDYEDARYEVDMLLYRNARSIQVFEDLIYGMSKLEKTMLDHIQLDDSLGGSSVIHKLSVQLLYKDDGNLVIDRLQKFPALFIPGVLKNMKVRDGEWIEMRARWNLLISLEVTKFIDKCRRQKTQRLKRKR